jgi:hypothetical protein
MTAYLIALAVEVAFIVIFFWNFYVLKGDCNKPTDFIGKALVAIGGLMAAVQLGWAAICFTHVTFAGAIFAGFSLWLGGKFLTAVRIIRVNPRR